MLCINLVLSLENMLSNNTIANYWSFLFHCIKLSKIDLKLSRNTYIKVALAFDSDVRNTRKKKNSSYSYYESDHAYRKYDISGM